MPDANVNRPVLCPCRLDDVRAQFRSVFGSEPYSATRARLLTEVRTQYQHIQAANSYRIHEVGRGNNVLRKDTRGGIISLVSLHIDQFVTLLSSIEL